MTSAHDFRATTIDGETLELSTYQGKVLLVVNTASKCGYTPQYEGLQTLFETYGDRGLVVLGFPCDQFGHQEPGTEQEIATFCSTTYDVTFPMFGKVEVNGPEAHPLFNWLTADRPEVPGGQIDWNFAKFLIDVDGNLVRRYPPAVKPDELAEDIEQLLE